MFVSKILLSLSLAVGIMSAHSNAVDPYANDLESLIRIYVYFSGVRISPEILYTQGYFYSNAGDSITIQGHLCESSFQNSYDDYFNRIYYFDIPKETTLCSFEILGIDDNRSWSNTNLYLLKGVWFEYKTSNYLTIDPETGWKDADLEIPIFCNYILSDIDSNNSNQCYGFGSYENLNKSFMPYIEKQANPEEYFYSWIDLFSGEETTFIDKWNEIKTNYLLNYKNEQPNYVWMYVVGGTLLVISSYYFIVSIVKNYGKKKRTTN